MCVKLSGSSGPGDLMTIFTKKGTQLNMWGFNKGAQYNVRFDKLDTTWRHFNMNRGILKVKNFWEGKGSFVHVNNEFFKIGVLYTLKDEFAIITVDANEIVKPWHHRMPLILTDESVPKFMDGALDISVLDNSFYRINNLKQVA